MKRAPIAIPRPLLALAMGLGGLFVLADASADVDEVQVGRYSTLPPVATAAQADLLAVIITVRIPESAQTVGDAVRYLLLRSGYRLQAMEAMNPDTVDLLALPLPAVHRAFGPMVLRHALEMLAGPAFRLVQDPQHRLISFELCPLAKGATESIDSGWTKEDPHDGG
jgi:type IV pili sensor histidine kinase/response regulator